MNIACRSTQNAARIKHFLRLHIAITLLNNNKKKHNFFIMLKRNSINVHSNSLLQLALEICPKSENRLAVYRKSSTINVYLSVMVYSGWKLILFLVFGRMTSNFMCLTFSTLCSSSPWRIV